MVGSISYLYILSSNFTRCVVCKVGYKIWNFGNFFQFVTLTLSCFDLGSDVYHYVWVIMGRWGVSQNAGVLVVLVSFKIHFIYSQTIYKQEFCSNVQSLMQWPQDIFYVTGTYPMKAAVSCLTTGASACQSNTIYLGRTWPEPDQNRCSQSHRL